ncbi:hypothetical protein VTH06DRAFT_4918 [Thermothelomyces fergusii]
MVRMMVDADTTRRNERVNWQMATASNLHFARNGNDSSISDGCSMIHVCASDSAVGDIAEERSSGLLGRDVRSQAVPAHAFPPSLVSSPEVRVPRIILKLVGCILPLVRVKHKRALWSVGHTLHHGVLGRVDAVRNHRG